MKKLFVLFSIILLLFAFTDINAQNVVGVKTFSYGTVANSVDEDYQTFRFQGLINEFGCNKIDSMIISLSVEGEADIDSLMWYPCNFADDGTVIKGTVRTFTVTLNIAAGAYGTEVLKVTNSGVGGSLFRGYEGFTLFTRGAAAGNDATDPNSLKVSIMFYGS